MEEQGQVAGVAEFDAELAMYRDDRGWMLVRLEV